VKKKAEDQYNEQLRPRFVQPFHLPEDECCLERDEFVGASQTGAKKHPQGETAPKRFASSLEEKVSL